MNLSNSSTEKIRLWIFDHDETPQRHPLGVLIQAAIAAVGGQLHSARIERSEGYGATINKWGEQLDECDCVPTTREELGRVASGVDEWFYWADIVLVTSKGELRVGLHDSSALFIEGRSDVVSEAVKDFTEVKRVDASQ